jgi:hypothetical protein
MDRTHYRNQKINEVYWKKRYLFLESYTGDKYSYSVWQKAEFLNVEADGIHSYHFTLSGYSAASYASDFLTVGTKVNLGRKKI